MPEAVLRATLAIVLALCAALALAREAAPEAADPALEARMTRITAELRCLVCQNQTIADSNAGLAVDLRRETREMLRQGKSDAEIVAYMTARYGDFVLYRPPLKSTTALLWFGPAAMLAIGAVVLLLVLRRRTKMAADAFEPDADEEGGEGEAEPAPAAAASRP
ncbi:MAG: cytochrome c-type biogenesis protein CcmH [Burkholderiales bacterium]|nr:cytochrome c-type biogenesis protein CcmH [Burkholderiales bacterium]